MCIIICVDSCNKVFESCSDSESEGCCIILSFDVFRLKTHLLNKTTIQTNPCQHWKNSV